MSLPGLKLALYCLVLTCCCFSVLVTWWYGTSSGHRAFAHDTISKCFLFSPLYTHCYLFGFKISLQSLFREEVFILQLGQIPFLLEPLLQVLIVYLLTWLYESTQIDFNSMRCRLNVAVYHYVPSTFPFI